MMTSGGRRRAPIPAINTTVTSYQTTSQPSTSSHSSHHATTSRSRHAPAQSRSSAASSARSSIDRHSQRQHVHHHNPSSASSSQYGDNQQEDDSDDQVFYVQAMHDFDSATTEVTCLSFRAGQIIRVFNRHQTGWWDGECNGQRGWFPSNYVNTQISVSLLRTFYKTSVPAR